GDEKRIAKIDLLNITNPRAVRYTERGYTTEHDIKALSQLKDPEKHHIAELCDYYKLDEGIFISVEKFFEGRTLDEIIKEDGPLSLKQFENIFSQVLEAEKYLMDQGWVHRDIKANNIIINEKGEVRLTDLANACKRENLSKKLFATAGSKSYTDPRSQGVFIGEESEFRISSDFYSIGVNMVYALTGKLPFEYDPDKRTAVDFKGRSLLKENKTYIEKTEDGKRIVYKKVDWKKHEKSLEEALELIPEEAEGYKGVIRRCLTSKEEPRKHESIDYALSLVPEKIENRWLRKVLPENLRENVGEKVRKYFERREQVRYSSIDEVISDFERKKHLIITKKRGLIFGAGVAALGLTLGIGGIHLESRYNEMINQAKAEAKKYPVSVKWTENQEIVNNLISLDFAIWTDEPWNCVYGDNGKPPFLSFKQGQKIEIRPEPKAIPKGDCSLGFPTFSGKVYIEGWKGKEFKTSILSVNTDGYDEFYSPTIPQIKMTIPEDMPDGNYKLCVVVYAPEKPGIPGYINAISDVKFIHTGRCLAMKTIPIVVGDLDERICISTLSFDWGYDTQYFNVERVEMRLHYQPGMNPPPDLDKKLVYELSVPETGWSRNTKNMFTGKSSSFGEQIKLPDSTDSIEKTLLIMARQDGKPILFAAYPFKGEEVTENFYRLKLAIPGRNFSDKIEEYRKKYFSNNKPR
ncbi:MAG: protein kinase, partial [Candidatus Coatesbacteria bacterium]|nr:protein kinase [Candidatus Coatesbacteria bacterium]